MQFFKDFDFKKPLNIFKIGVLSLFGISALVFVASLVNSSVRPLLRGGMAEKSQSVPPTYSTGMGYSGEEAVDMAYYKGAPAGLSIRNILPPEPPSPGTVGNNAEDFEVTDYDAYIETRKKQEVCASITDLKSLKYVIFELSQESDKTCIFTFKVEHAHAAEILAIIKDLKPKDLSENTRTIKTQLDDFTNQIEILEKKRASIDETLRNAIKAYDEITALAVRTQDAASLAKIIDSKIQVIERLTQEKININQQLDYLARAKADQMDRLKYTYFNIRVYENKYLDEKTIKDSWIAAVQDFFFTINEALQNASINLIALLFVLIPYVIYALIILVAAKYGWRLAKYIWNK
ncbi:MAG: hypothetical protein HYT15_01740 [Candidatus Magasanikbacteria bacterium]|nr:hypothetical protein [Candidatus Magasanikbacteria bacterium]